MKCPSCLRALQLASHREYREGCLGCDVRQLVHMQADDRELALDRIERLHGRAARIETVRLVELEAARIRVLRRRAVAH